MNSALLMRYSVPGLLATCLSAAVAEEKVDAVRLVYHEKEQGIDPYTAVYTVSDSHVRIDDESDSSGYIVFDIGQKQIYSISHFNRSILVIPEYPPQELKSDFKLDIEYWPISDAPAIAGKAVYNYRVRAIDGDATETCMDIQLVPGLMPDVAKSLQAFQAVISGQHANNLASTPEEYQTPCFLVDQIFNKGDYYTRGLPIQEWHSNDKTRQLINYENTKVDTSFFGIPADYRQYSIDQSKN